MFSKSFLHKVIESWIVWYRIDSIYLATKFRLAQIDGFATSFKKDTNKPNLFDRIENATEKEENAGYHNGFKALTHYQTTNFRLLQTERVCR